MISSECEVSVVSSVISNVDVIVGRGRSVVSSCIYVEDLSRLLVFKTFSSLFIRTNRAILLALSS